MANQLFKDMQDRALRATFALHDDMTGSSAQSGFDGYNGTKEDFDRLFNEVFIITRDEVPDDAEVDQILETFYDYQLEILNGDRSDDWYR
jgi:hypothetical protein